MAAINHLNWFARPLIWAIVLGFVGFIFGYYGQDILLVAPGSAAPLIGIVVTGPIGFLVGLLLGGLSARIHLSTKQNLIFLAIAALASSVGTLYFTVSEYRPAIWLVDAEIVGCEQVDQLLERKTKHWSREVIRVKKEGIIDPRPNWEQEIPDMLQAKPGAVLSIRIYQEAWINEQKWSWGSISRRADSWKSVNENLQVFAPIIITDPVQHSLCERFVLGERRFFALRSEHSNDYPPSKLAEFLQLRVLQQVPPEYIRYIPTPK